MRTFILTLRAVQQHSRFISLKSCFLDSHCLSRRYSSYGGEVKSSGATDTSFDAPFLMASQSGLSDSQLDIREAIRSLTSQFSNDYWLQCDREGRCESTKVNLRLLLKWKDPHELYDALSKGQWLGITLPTEVGGSGLGISEAAIMLQTIAESGGGGQWLILSSC